MQIIDFSATHIFDLTSISEINKSGIPTLPTKVEVDYPFYNYFRVIQW
jgi:hypothetical protein